VGNAMQRNKLIYALADTSLVVRSDLNKGGTWTGAVEQLDKLKFVPVFIRSTGESCAGLDALRKKGALPWPNPQDVDSFEDVFNVVMPTPRASPQVGFALFSNEEPTSDDTKSTVPVPRDAAQTPQAGIEPAAPIDEAQESSQPESPPAELLLAAVRKAIHQLLNTPMKDTEVAAALDVSNAQAKAWLQRLVEEGVLEKEKKPVRYVLKEQCLFD